MEWMLLPLRRYARTSGRARRKEYWMFYLFVMIVTFVLAMVDALAGLNMGGSDNGLLSGLFGLAMLVPNIAVTIRRLHDTDRSGWWLLLPLAAIVPGALLIAAGLTAGAPVMIGGVILALVALLVFLCLDGTPGDNRFGPDPKQPDHQDLGEIFA